MKSNALGFREVSQNKSGVRDDKHSKPTFANTTTTTKYHIPGCLRSKYSILSMTSFGSVNAIASVLAVVSVFSIVSIGSICSFLSLGSIASVLSVASRSSIVSVASNGCVFGMHQNCLYKHRVYDTTTEFEITIAESTWDTMAACSREDYNSDDSPDRCDYQDATCVFKNLTSGYIVNASCEVRRKGHGSWRDMDSKPSFKVKKFKDTTASDKNIHFGTFSCGGAGDDICPPGKAENAWTTNKVLLQNQFQYDGEIDAYNLLRKFVPTPQAVQTTLKLYRGGVLQREDTYVLFENVDDSSFLKKWFGDNYALYELESGPEALFERYGGTEIENTYVKNQSEIIQNCKDKCSGVTDCFEKCRDDEVEDSTESVLEDADHLETIVHLGLSDFNQDNVVKYFAGEVATYHWDGACILEGKQKNHYVLFNGSQYFYIPKGMDQTFQCPKTNKHFRVPQCPPVKECFDDATCLAAYKEAQDQVDKAATRKYDCPEWEETALIATLVPLGSTLLVLFLAYCIQKYMSNK